MRVLDEVQHLAQLEAFDRERYARDLAGEVATLPHGTIDELGAKLDALRALLAEIDGFAQKCMAIRLNQLSADPIPTQLRTLLKTTVIAYERQMDLLRGRVATAMARIERYTADDVTDRVMDAASRVLSLRAELRAAVFQLVAPLAAEIQKAPRDRTLPTEQRQRWGQARLDLEQLKVRPELLEVASFAERLKKIPPPPEEAETESTEEKRFSLLEID